MPCLLNYSIIQRVIYSFRYPECPQKYIFISHWIVSCCFRQFAAWMNCNRKSTTQTEKWIWFRKMISESAIYHYELIIEHCSTKYSDARYHWQGYVFDEHDCDVIFHWLIPCSHFWDNEKKTILGLHSHQRHSYQCRWPYCMSKYRHYITMEYVTHTKKGV